MEAAKDVMQRVGSKGTVGATVAALCRRLTPSLLAPEHVAELLRRAQTVGFLLYMRRWQTWQPHECLQIDQGQAALAPTEVEADTDSLNANLRLCCHNTL